MFLLVSLVGEILSRIPTTDPTQHGRFTYSACMHFLPDKKEKEEKAKVKSASCFWDAQCLFRKSSGFCVFHMSFAEPQTHVKWAPGANEAETRHRASGSLSTQLRAEASDWQACFVIAHWQARKRTS